MQRNAHSFADIAKMSSWCKEHAEELKGMRAVDLVTCIFSATGIKPTVGAAKAIADGLGIELRAKGQRDPNTVSRDRVMLLAREVESLYKQLGLEITPRLQALVSKQAVKD